MARIEYVKAARKDQDPCGRCGAEIKKGDPYKHASPGFRGPKLVRCDNCTFRQSELTTSLLAGIYAAQEQAHDDLDGLSDDWTTTEDVDTILQTCASEAEDVQGQYEEAAEAMGAAGEEHQEKADLIESWASDLTDVTFDDPPEWPAGEEPGEEELESEWENWREGVIEAAREAIDAFEG